LVGTTLPGFIARNKMYNVFLYPCFLCLISIYKQRLITFLKLFMVEVPLTGGILNNFIVILFRDFDCKFNWLKYIAYSVFI
jgi:hypothetical protein